MQYTPPCQKQQKSALISCVNKSHSFWNTWYPQYKTSVSTKQTQKGALIPVWRGQNLMSDVRKLPGKWWKRERERAEFQINFKPLSPVNAKPQQLSCCDPILFFAPSPLFLTLETVSCWSTQPRTISNTRQERQIFPEPPPPRCSHLVEQLWWQYFENVGA